MLLLLTGSGIIALSTAKSFKKYYVLIFRILA